MYNLEKSTFFTQQELLGLFRETEHAEKIFLLKGIVQNSKHPREDNFLRTMWIQFLQNNDKDSRNFKMIKVYIGIILAEP